MAGETVITVVGNLVDDPELRFTPSGAAVANFRIASTPRNFDRQTNEWVDGEGLFLSCAVWRQAAENVAESLQKGMRVVVQGRLKQRSYETREGEKRTVYDRCRGGQPEPEVRHREVTRTTRQGGGGGYSGGGNQQGGGAPQEWRPSGRRRRPVGHPGSAGRPVRRVRRRQRGRWRLPAGWRPRPVGRSRRGLGRAPVLT